MCICFSYDFGKPYQGNKLFMDGYNVHLSLLFSIGIVGGKDLEDIME